MTRRTTSPGLAAWEEFKAAHGGREDAATVAEWIEALAASGLAESTIRIKRLGPVRAAFRRARKADPLMDPRVQDALSTAAATSAPREGVRPLTPPLLWAAADACLPPAGEDEAQPLAGLRDRALLLVAYAGALRPGEIAGLTRGAIQPRMDGFALDVGRPTGRVRVAADGGPNCPTAALTGWLDVAVEGPAVPVFQKLSTNGMVALGQPLGSQWLSQIVRAAVARTGEDPAGYTAGSMRAGRLLVDRLAADLAAVGHPQVGDAK